MKHKSAQLQHKQFAFKAGPVNDDGTFSGYGSVFGNLDSYREIVAPGAFAESLTALKASGDPLPALWQHRGDSPIGGYDILEEDEHGLKVSGWLMVNEIPLAAQAHALMKRRVVKGLSIGYYVRGSSYDEKENILTLTALDLVEISIVTFPANAEAKVDNVKAIADGDLKKAISWLKRAIKLHEGHMDGSVPTSDESQMEMMQQMKKSLSFLTGEDASMGSMKVAMTLLPTLREFEKSLREQGYSKALAEKIAAGGFKQLLGLGDQGGGEINPISAALAALRS